MTYRLEEPWLPASESLTEWGQDFHELLLGDRLRMRTFQAAIGEIVRPGDVVVDLGTGTGILAQWALQAGAARVYGIDFSAEVLADAVGRLAAAGYGADRFVPVRGLSSQVTLPERARVLLSETLGNLADNEGCVPMLVDARERFLGPDGILLPAAVEAYLVPVDSVAAHRAVAERRIRGAGHDAQARLNHLGAASPFDLYYDTILPVSRQLAAPRVSRRYEFRPGETDEYELTLTFPVLRAGSFTGFKGYFVADLSPTTAIDISGDDIAAGLTSDSWKHCYLPIAGPVEVLPGDQVSLTFGRRAVGDEFGQRYRWAGAVHRNGTPVGQFAQSTRPGAAVAG